MRKKYMKLGENQNGAVAIIVALSMTVFLGIAALAIDVGVMGLSKNELQNAADSAALAGASQLAHAKNDATIKKAAKDAAKLNISSKKSITLSDADVVIGTWDWDNSSFSGTSSDPDNAVKVTISNHDVNLFFTSDRGMGASSVAIVGPLSGMTGLIPIGVTQAEAEKMVEGYEYIIYEKGESPGNWGTIDFDNSPGTVGTKELGEWLKDGYDGTVSVGDFIDTAPGVGKIVGNQNADKVEALQGQTLFLPVVLGPFPSGAGQGNKEDPMEVVGFIAIEIEVINGQGSNTKVLAKYLGEVTMGGNVDLGNQSFGVLGVKLAQ